MHEAKEEAKVIDDELHNETKMQKKQQAKRQTEALDSCGLMQKQNKEQPLYCGFEAAEGEVVYTIDADLQDSPDEIPAMRKMILEEVYRFENGASKRNGHDCWDLDHLYKSILEGMKACGEMGKAPVSMGIDTFGVDFVLLDDNGEIIGLVPDTIIIPNTAKAKDEVFGILGAHNDPNTPAGNRYNYQFGNWDVLVIPWLNDLVAADGSYPWILMDSNYNESNYGAIDVERIPLAITSDKDRNNDANRWAGRARFGGAFGNFRAFAAGGLDFGTAA